MLHQSSYIFTNLLQDLAPSKQSPGNLVDARNIRIVSNEGATALSITNEKEPVSITLNTPIKGKLLGHCILNNYVILFTIDSSDSNPDKIYKVDIPNKNNELLFEGNLGFSEDHLIEAISDYESENIQKVYWIDGKNLPRVINIVRDYSESWDGVFDFVPELLLKETVSVTKNVSSKGKFPSGVILYALSYYNKHLQETNIFYVTPLSYISPYDRGGRPDEIVANTFKISVSNIDSHFDCIRIYSIHRASLDGLPSCKKVVDLEIGNLTTISYEDTGLVGETVDPYSIMYQANLQKIIPQTICVKDNTLFLGNLKTEYFDKELGEYLTGELSTNRVSRPSINVLLLGDTSVSNSLQEYAAGLKRYEWYRVGVLLQHKTGVWSRPIYIGDIQTATTPASLAEGISAALMDYNADSIGRVGIQIKLDFTELSKKIDLSEYKKIRPLIADTSLLENTILYQGVMTPNLFTSRLRNGKVQTYINADGSQDITIIQHPTLWAQSSWFFRPIYDLNQSEIDIDSNIFFRKEFDKYSETTCSPYSNFNFKDYTWENYLPYIKFTNASLSGTALTTIPKTNIGVIKAVEVQGIFDNENLFQIDLASCNLNTPDIIIDPSIQAIPLSNYKARICGEAQITKTLGAVHIETSTSSIGIDAHKLIDIQLSGEGANGIITGAFYEDYIVDDVEDDLDGNDEVTTVIYQAYDKQDNPVKWAVFPWQRSGSINNDTKRRDGSTSTATLSKKILSNLRFCGKHYYHKDYQTLPLAEIEYGNSTIDLDPQLFNSEESTIIKLGSDIYLGNIDTLILPDKNGLSHFAIGTTALNLNAVVNAPTAKVSDKINHVIFAATKQLDDSNHPTVVRGVFSGSVVSDTSGNLYPNSPAPLLSVHEDLLPDSSGNISNDYKTAFLGDYDIGLCTNRNPVRMRYKSTPHIVLNLKNGNWASTFRSKVSSNSTAAKLPIVELYKEGVTALNFLGGNSRSILESHKWLPANKALDLEINNNQMTVSCIWGDTFLGWYDVLKTYPFTSEDPNLIVEIATVGLESRFNLDGRYDRNRGLVDNTIVSPTNFNLFNTVYSQKDNFFSYTMLDESLYKLDSYPNQITWTLLKNPGEDTDTWTSLTLASVFNVDGIKGPINALKTWNDNIICFQDNIVNRIVFNPRVLIPVSDGVPIEITNNYKLEGKQCILEESGCYNKFAIASTPNALYYLDSLTKHLRVIGKEAPVDISSAKFMENWFEKLKNYLGTANEYTTRLLYDNLNKDIYTSTATESLYFSESFAGFISFMDYNSLLGMFTINGNTYSIKQDGNNIVLQQMFIGTLNMPFSISFVVNGKNQDNDLSTLTKVFDTIELRGFARNNVAICPINFLKIENEYQNSGIKANYSMVQKFRVWRGLLPRHLNTRQRIRNPWSKITIGNTSTDKVILDDITVKYSI